MVRVFLSKGPFFPPACLNTSPAQLLLHPCMHTHPTLPYHPPSVYNTILRREEHRGGRARLLVLLPQRLQPRGTSLFESPSSLLPFLCFLYLCFPPAFLLSFLLFPQSNPPPPSLPPSLLLYFRRTSCV